MTHHPNCLCPPCEEARLYVPPPQRDGYEQARFLLGLAQFGSPENLLDYYGAYAIHDCFDRLQEVEEKRRKKR